MDGLKIYELVNAKMRDCFNLMSAEDTILVAIADAYPEAINAQVFESFYCFTSPVKSRSEHNRRARSLGRALAVNMPELTKVAMRSYSSKANAKSNQLFKLTNGKRRRVCCMERLNKR